MTLRTSNHHKVDYTFGVWKAECYSKNDVMKLNSNFAHKSHWNCPKLLFIRTRRTSGVRTAQRRQKTTTQRRGEGQMKSCVSNNVLPIPREIYFSGFAVSTPKWYFEILLYTIAYRKKTSAASLETTKRPSTFQKTMGVKFLYVCCALFSHGFKARNRKKANFKSSRNCNRINAAFCRISHMDHRIGFPIGISLTISTLGLFGVEAAIDSIQFIRFNRQLTWLDMSMKSDIPIGITFSARKFTYFHNFPPPASGTASAIELEQCN